MKFRIVLPAMLLYSAILSATALSDLAGSMKAGEWKELVTSNITNTIQDNGADGSLISYTDEMVWYPDSQLIMAVQCDHYGSGQQFICYDAKTNTWSRRARPSWFSSGTVHGYDHQAIDVKNGYFYHQPACCRAVTKRYNLATHVWSDVGDALDYYESYMGFEYFPEINGLVRINNYDGGARGTVKFLADGASAWTTLASGLTMGGIHIFSEYNPVSKVVVFGGGEGDRHIYKMNASKQVTALGLAPVGLGIQQAVFTVDPVSGDYLVFANRDNAQFYVYNVQTDTWTLKSSAVQPIYHPDPGWAVLGIAATPIADYGINFFVSAIYYQFKVFLYKHSAGTAVESSSPGCKTTLRLDISPNPLRTNAGISLSNPGRVSIYDISGNLVKRLAGPVKETVWTPEASTPGGIYIVKAQAGQQSISKRIVIQR